ncbi:MAG: acyl carrier protein [Patescibacteria group bacterium]
MSKLKTILSKILNLDENSINDATSPDNVESWDSFNGLMIVSELESAFGVKFTMDEVVSVKSVGEIKAALARHGAVLEE